MTHQSLRGWGFREIEWLLQEVATAGGAVPSRYYRSGDHPDEWSAVREARLKLGQSISRAFTWEKVHGDLGSDAAARQRLERLGSISGQLQRALGGLEGDPGLLSLLDPKVGVDWTTGVGLDGILAGMHRLKSAVDAARRDFPERGLFTGSTGQETLFRQLATAYRRGMDAEPADGIVKTHRAHHGPFVAFVRAALSLEGRPPQTDAALTKALQRHVLGGPPGQ